MTFLHFIFVVLMEAHGNFLHKSPYADVITVERNDQNWSQWKGPYSDGFACKLFRFGFSYARLNTWVYATTRKIHHPNGASGKEFTILIN